MNKNRLIGISLLTIGIILMNTVDNDLSSFISGILIGIGGTLTISGKTVFSKQESN